MPDNEAQNPQDVQYSSVFHPMTTPDGFVEMVFEIVHRNLGGYLPEIRQDQRDALEAMIVYGAICGDETYADMAFRHVQIISSLLFDELQIVDEGVEAAVEVFNHAFQQCSEEVFQIMVDDENIEEMSVAKSPEAVQKQKALLMQCHFMVQPILGMLDSKEQTRVLSDAYRIKQFIHNDDLVPSTKVPAVALEFLKRAATSRLSAISVISESERHHFVRLIGRMVVRLTLDEEHAIFSEYTATMGWLTGVRRSQTDEAALLTAKVLENLVVRLGMDFQVFDEKYVDQVQKFILSLGDGLSEDFHKNLATAMDAFAAAENTEEKIKAARAVQEHFAHALSAPSKTGVNPGRLRMTPAWAKKLPTIE